MEGPKGEMAGLTENRLVACYISGLDLRRIDSESTPFLARAFGRYPKSELVNLPSNELFPTLVTGVDPTRHGVWGVKLRAPPEGAFSSRLVDHLPDFVTTTVQGCLHFATNAYDLAAIPPWRRRRFDITRTKYKRRNRRPEALFNIGSCTSVFDVVGANRCRYLFNSSMEPVRRLLPRVGNGGHVLELLELYSLDRYQQWNLDRAETVRRFYTRIDDFLGRLHRRCEETGAALMLISDHGHEPIRGSIDIQGELERLGLRNDTYSCFVEVSSVRFWFHGEEARNAITAMLASLNNGSLLTYRDMGQYGVPLDDSLYGEVFYFLDPGWIFFPHDFHHALANLWLGLVDPMQRSRLRDPRHKGNHGHLPHFETERSFIMLLSDEYQVAAPRGNILDVAPSMLGVLGYEPPSTMTGRRLFSRNSPA